MKTSFSAARQPVVACLRLCALTCTFGGAVSALAQSGKPLPSVTVTANRFAQDLQSSSVNVAVITGAQILDSGATDANDAIRKLLGVPYRTDLRGGRDYTLDLRGFGATADQNVVVIVNGVRISENELATARLSAIAPEMIESIEVVRGGSSVQWGEGASAGLINIVLKQGAAKGISGSVTTQVESFAGRDMRANLRVGGDIANFDANVRSYITDGFRENSANRQDTASVGVSGESGPLKLRLRVSSESQGARFPGALTFAQFDADPRQTKKPNDYGDFNETRVTVGGQYRLDAWNFALDMGARDHDATSFYLGYNSEAKSRSTQVSPKVTYTGALASSALTLVVGADIQHWDYKATDSAGQNEIAAQFNDAWYISADVLTTTGTRVSAGVRNEQVLKRADDPVNFVSYNRTDSLDAWDFGVNQALGNGFNAYGRTAKAYRLPNVDENRYLAAALRPQITRDLELGLKWQSDAGNRATLSVFTQSAVDEIAYDPVAFSNVNLDPTRRAGVQADGYWKLAKDWTLSGSVQTVSATFTQGANTGKEIPLVSSVSAALRLGWALDAHQSLAMGLQHQGSARFGNDNANTCTGVIPASTLLDARYSWKQAKLEWSLAASNLTDVKGYSQAYSCTQGSLYPDPGRSIKAALKYNF